MEFKGTFGIRHFKTLEGNAARIQRDVRDAFKLAFYESLGRSVYAYAIRIPVLTGDTRQGLVPVLQRIDMEIARAGGTGAYASALDFGLTESKQDEDHIPQPVSDYQYYGYYWWPPKEANYAGKRIKYHSRLEWRVAVENTTHFPSDNVDSRADFSLSGNAWAGSFSFWMAHGNEYWESYGWNMNSWLEAEFQEQLNLILVDTVRQLTSYVIKLGDSTGMAAQSTSRIGQGSIKEVGGVKGSHFPHLSVDFADLGDVPF